MNENRFWTLIESAWENLSGASKARQKLVKGTLSQAKADKLQDDLDDVIAALTEQLGLLPAKDLLAFDRILEQKLHGIDREDVHEYTDGSDDGFLYARGFIVVAGKEHYDAVFKQPSIVKVDLECEDMCYLSANIYDEKFGVVPPSGISRESCANKIGWPNLT